MTFGDGEPGELQLGGHDQASVTGPITFVPVVKRCASCMPLHYEVLVSSLKLGDDELLLFGHQKPAQVSCVRVCMHLWHGSVFICACMRALRRA